MPDYTFFSRILTYTVHMRTGSRERHVPRLSPPQAGLHHSAYMSQVTTYSVDA